MHRAVEITECAEHLGGHRGEPGPPHRFLERTDSLRVERAALLRHIALLFQHGDAALDDEVGGSRQCTDRREGDDQTRNDSDASQREPRLEPDVLASQHMTNVIVFSRGPYPLFWLSFAFDWHFS